MTYYYNEIYEILTTTPEAFNMDFKVISKEEALKIKQKI